MAHQKGFFRRRRGYIVMQDRQGIVLLFGVGAVYLEKE
jgi:hypothetical protein